MDERELTVDGADAFWIARCEGGARLVWGSVEKDVAVGVKEIDQAFDVSSSSHGGTAG
jgi:hypothetical protein